MGESRRWEGADSSGRPPLVLRPAPARPLELRAIIEEREAAQRLGEDIRARLGILHPADFVVLGESFLAGLFGRSAAGSGWRPCGQTIDQCEQGLETWERLVTVPQRLELPGASKRRRH